jgi:hypothetical protein
MVQLIPEINNPTQEEINEYVSKMINANNHDILNDVVREIQSKKSVGALLHPSEEYYIDTVFKCVNVAIFNILLQSI